MNSLAEKISRLFLFRGRRDCPSTFSEELNYQSSRVLLFASIVYAVGWLFYIPVDLQLHPEEPLIIVLRVGLSVMGILFLSLYLSKDMMHLSLHFLTIMAIYLEISTGLITALAKGSPVYVGGYLFILTLLAVVPIRRRDAWLILAISLGTFFIVGFSKGMSFETNSASYTLRDIISTSGITAFFIFLLDHLRFESWRNFRKLSDQQDELKFYKDLTINLPVGVFRTKIDGRFESINPAFARMCGIDYANLSKDTKFSEFFVDPAEFRKISSGLRTKGQLSNIELSLKRVNGSSWWGSLAASLVSNGSGKYDYIDGIIEDITDRKQVAETLRESEEKFRQIVNTLTQLVSIWDMNLHCTYTSPSILRLLGYTQEEALTLKIEDIISHESIQVIGQLMQEALFQEKVLGRAEPFTHEIEEIRKDGCRVAFENTYTFLRDKNGVPEGILVLSNDITERKQVANALQESEEKFRKIVNNLTQGVSIWTLDKKCIYVSPASFRIFGYTPEEMLNLKNNENLTAESKAKLDQAFLERLNIERTNGFDPNYCTTLELEEIRKDGSLIICESTYTFLRDTNNAPVGILILTNDITERKRQESQREEAVKALRKSEERYRLITENSDDVIWTTDTELKFTFVSPAIRKLRGFEPEEAVQETIVQTMTLESANNLLTAYNRSLPEIEKGGNLNMRLEIEQYRKDGSTVWVEISTRTMRNHAGELTGFVGVSRDISERRQAEMAIRESERRLADIINFLPIATMVIDKEGRVTAWNHAIEEMTGVGSEAIVGKGDYEYALPFYGQRIPILIDLVFVAEEELETTYKYVRREGEILTAESFCANLGEKGRTLVGFASALFGSDGTVIGAIESIRDMTSLREAEAELNKAKEAAEAANRSKSAFLANMSHEIRTPMNAILGFAQLMQRDSELSAKQREHLEIINRSGEHLLALINDILELSKIEAGRLKFIPSSFDLHKLLDDLEMMFRVRTDEKKLRFMVEKVGDVPRWVTTDEGKLRQVLINLVGNAVKFTEEGGIGLRVGAQSDGTRGRNLIFEVEDTGPGIAVEEIENLFKAFEQASAGIRMGGTGLGLALSRGFIQMMGGTISVTSEVGRGSIFRFVIPVGQGAEETEEWKEVKRRVLMLKPVQEGIRVLVADDRETNRQLLTQILETTGFETREAVNGAEAIAEFQAWNPQLILMDMTMPVMDGYEAMRRIKTTPEGRAVKIIAITASAFQEDRKRVIEAGADGYVSKPFKEAELFETIRRLLKIEYIYEDESREEEAFVEDHEAQQWGEAIAALPTELVRQCREATDNADIFRLMELLEEVAKIDRPFAQKLKDLADRYAYDEIIDLL